MGTVSLVLIGGPLAGREVISKRPAYVSGEYVRVMDRYRDEHVYRVAPNCRIAFWVPA